MCGCMLLHHVSYIDFPRQYSWPRYLLPEVVLEELLYITRQQETNWEEWGSQDTTLCGDEMDDEQIDHEGDTEPLLREWLDEQRLLNQMDSDDTDDDTESSYSTLSTVDSEMDFWFSYGGSRYDGDGSPLVA
ncbi:uncharacterized protein TrAtP1_007668 [Trichoderma atroviride]|uniref:uncharacterized protein n=1 Tax=Hypocrea atroviridis TaxID=63577 RepID=UPI003327F7E5|nr:hypothetical protein TrAtP1_007668 [Trichoderma atroviride]